MCFPHNNATLKYFTLHAYPMGKAPLRLQIHIGDGKSSGSSRRSMNAAVSGPNLASSHTGQVGGDLGKIHPR